MRDFCCALVDATAGAVCAFKPQAAHFAAQGAEDQLAETIAYIRQCHPQLLVILDAKRGDIGSSAERYAREAFERYRSHAVTVNPYLGEESVAPFLKFPGRGAALLCRTSNPGSDWLQCHPPEDPPYLRVARAAAEWGKAGGLMLVAGATYPVHLARIREAAGSIPLLVPGVGAQGGDLQAVLDAGLDENGQGLVISASRSIIYAPGEDFAAAAETAAAALRRRIAEGVAQSLNRHQTGQWSEGRSPPRIS